jgi:hypothetical protein
MYTKIQVVFDAADPGKLAEFWALALDYVFEPPPEGHESWEDFARSIGLAEEEFGNLASVIDPAGDGPRLYFQRVPGKKRPCAENARGPPCRKDQRPHDH